MSNDNINNIEVTRHSLSHILALAVLELWPDVKFAIGPAIENGFYYDFDFGEEKIGEDDLIKIEKKMNHLIKQNLKFAKSELSCEEAIKKEKKAGQVYKVELIQDLKKQGEKKVSYYKLGKFEDLCRGPHIESIGKIAKGSFKLTKIAGAYWRGDEKNKMLTRVYGVAFDSKKELDEYLKMITEAEKRDHRKLGKELGLFSFHQESPGFVFWHEKGMAVWNELESFGKSLRKKYGYVEIKTPQMAKNTIWITSGHWDHYKDDMFVFDVDKEVYCLKPMDCPFNIKIYQTKSRSYKDLPIRYTEIGRVFRNEKSGELSGLFRVREISQDDSHIFLREDQIEEEIGNLLNAVREYYKALNVEPNFFFADRPDDFMGEIQTWGKAETALKKALKSQNIDYGLKEKDGAFYGPKIDVNIKDVFNRSWQVATIQLDFQLPGRFGCEYVDETGKKKTPVLIHAAIFGSFERMIGILIEHFGGAFPVWLSPVQVKIISVGEGHIEYCNKLARELKEHNIRVEVDDADETVGNKIRKSAQEKVPYMLVIGDKEIASNKLAVRDRGVDNLRQIGKDELIEEIKEKIGRRE
ncbi:MAG: threonine--tRNA ligase [Candidatus Falkowbacteria bacterium]